MKKIYHFILLIIVINEGLSQAPEIEWQNTIGGALDDILYSIQQTTDGGYILGGYSNSTNTGDKIEVGNGNYDYWVIKLDSTGDMEWQNTIGGSLDDNLISVKQTIDGGYILGGFSGSNLSGDKTEGYIGANDFWIIKLNSIGGIEWQNTIGGNFNDLFSMEQTLDGGYILGGSSASGISGDKTEGNIGGLDYWVIKLDNSGNIEWQNTIGGNQDDELTSIQETTDNGYIVGGFSMSGISGDKIEASLGGADYWIIKLDNLGNIQWQNTMGGGSDDKLRSIKQTADEGYILAGYSYSDISGDKTEPSVGIFGYADFWVLKIDAIGDIVWQNTIGGESNDVPWDVSQSYDGGYLLGGYSYSGIGGDKTEVNFGNSDYWVIRLDTLGNIVWQRTIGGNSFDVLFSIEIAFDGGYVLGGYSNSEISGDKTEGNMGAGISYTDYWVVKLYPEPCITPVLFYADSDGDGFGNDLISISACVAPPGYILNNTDCDDTNTAINPGATEICNALDDNCNLSIDDGLSSFIYYIDADADGYGNIIFTITTCSDSPPIGYTNNNTDCDDANSSIHEPIIYYADVDGDLYGDMLMADFFCTTIPPISYVVDSTDCNDLDSLINPYAIEICNAVDDNCNEEIDEGLAIYTYFVDADNDNYGDNGTSITSCNDTAPVGYISDSTDCDDSNPNIFPGAEEFENTIDDNCNDTIDEGFNEVEDFTVSSFSIYPNPNEGKFEIITNNINSIELTIEVFNLIGEKIYCAKFNSSIKIIIELPNSFSGMAIVFMKIESDSFSEFLNVY